MRSGGFFPIEKLFSIPTKNRRVPHISLVFREMWDIASHALKPPAGPGSVRVG